MVNRIVLPRVVGTRREVPAYTGELPSRLAGEDVILDCSGLLSATPSFADEIVDVILRERGAERLIAVGAGEDVIADLRSAADVRGLGERLIIRPVAATAAAS